MTCPEQLAFVFPVCALPDCRIPVAETGQVCPDCRDRDIGPSTTHPPLSPT